MPDDMCEGFSASSRNLLDLVAVGNVDGPAIGIEHNRGFSGLSPLFHCQNFNVAYRLTRHILFRVFPSLDDPALEIGV